MGVCHLPRLLYTEKVYRFVGLTPPTHDTHEVNKEALARVGRGPSGIPFRRAIQE